MATDRQQMITLPMNVLRSLIPDRTWQQYFLSFREKDSSIQRRQKNRKELETALSKKKLKLNPILLQRLNGKKPKNNKQLLSGIGLIPTDYSQNINTYVTDQVFQQSQLFRYLKQLLDDKSVSYTTKAKIKRFMMEIVKLYGIYKYIYETPHKQLQSWDKTFLVTRTTQYLLDIYIQETPSKGTFTLFFRLQKLGGSKTNFYIISFEFKKEKKELKSLLSIHFSDGKYNTDFPIGSKDIHDILMFINKFHSAYTEFTKKLSLYYEKERVQKTMT